MSARRMERLLRRLKELARNWQRDVDEMEQTIEDAREQGEDTLYVNGAHDVRQQDREELEQVVSEAERGPRDIPVMGVST